MQDTIVLVVILTIDRKNIHTFYKYMLNHNCSLVLLIYEFLEFSNMNHNLLGYTGGCIWFTKKRTLSSLLINQRIFYLVIQSIDCAC